MAKVADEGPKFATLPAGVTVLRELRDGKKILECHHNAVHRNEINLCLICKYSPGSGTKGWPPVKIVARVVNKYAELAQFESRKLKQWLRYWKKVVAGVEQQKGQELLYDPEEQVEMLTGELRSRGDL